MKQAGHLLVVDDDREICDLIRHFFERHGYRVGVAHDEAQMQSELRRHDFDLVVLDVMLPGRNGLDLCRDIRGRSQVPIIMVTAINETADRIVGLEMGADDYIAKPFEPRELLARVRAVIRRFTATAAAEPDGRPSQVLRFDDWTIDLAQRRLWSADNVVITLTMAEFDLLGVFVTHPRRTLSRDQLLDFTQGHAAQSFDRSIDILVSRLRRKLAGGAKAVNPIVTVRGGGYMLSSEVRPQ
ncbi:response regulator [Taklimakanibacter deserti]|uniref:response regulator n=1 Tax=Taklimakanibacter deserti TaxID=2267839 RepID=UPI000E64D406